MTGDINHQATTREDDSTTTDASEKVSAQGDLSDPGTWPEQLNGQTLDLLVQKGPVKVCNCDFPLAPDKRHFSEEFYVRKLPNGEKTHRDWLVYSKRKDSVFCFCCKLFGSSRSNLANGGNNDWKHLSAMLKQHETSHDHISSATKWIEAKRRFDSEACIDQSLQQQISREKAHWQDVLTRIIAAVQFLAESNLAFRGTNSKLHKENNGHFLKLIEMISKFDAPMSEHVRRIKDNETRAHCLGPQTQNELISQMATNIKNSIVNDTKRAKYFSVILDCTPDMSHQEQMSLVLHFVNMASLDVSVEEHFIECSSSE